MNKGYIKRLLLCLSIFAIPLVVLSCSDSLNTQAGSTDVSSKPTAPVSISYQLAGPVKPDKEVTITMYIKAGADVDDLLLRLKASEGLDITSEKNEIYMGQLKRNSTATVKIKVMALKEGHHLLKIILTGKINGNTIGRAIAIPVSTTEAPERVQKGAGTVTTDSEGKRIIIMPAQEERD